MANRYMIAMNQKLILVVAIFFATTSKAFSQQEVTVADVKGVSYIAGDVSENQARQKAINEAKIEALKKAGIGEYINSYQTLFTSQANNDYSQFFNSDIQSEIQGAVKSYNVKSENKWLNDSIKQIEYDVIIDATVIKYDTKPDAAFKANVDGIKGAYNNKDKLVFNVKTAQDAYLTIFSITDSEASLMYPNAVEKSQLFEKEKTYSFPLASNLLDYEMVTQKEKETNRLIFVFTKTPYSYVDIKGDGQVTDAEKIFSWIYSIMPDQRYVEYFPFFIVK